MIIIKADGKVNVKNYELIDYEKNDKTWDDNGAFSIFAKRIIEGHFGLKHEIRKIITERESELEAQELVKKISQAMQDGDEIYYL